MLPDFLVSQFPEVNPLKGLFIRALIIAEPAAPTALITMRDRFASNDKHSLELAEALVCSLSATAAVYSQGTSKGNDCNTQKLCHKVWR